MPVGYLNSNWGGHNLEAIEVARETLNYGPSKAANRLEKHSHEVAVNRRVLPSVAQ